MTKITNDTEVSDVTPEQQIQATRIMGGIGVAFVFVFLLTIAYSVYENSKTIAVQGTVIDISSKETSTGDRGTYYSYGHVFEFTDVTGVKRTGSDNGERQSKYRIGDNVSIGYYPDNPNRVRIHSWFGLWKLQLTFLGFGFALIWYMIVAVKIIKAKMLAPKT